MNRARNRSAKTLVNENYAISYRQDKRVSWTTEGRADYGMVFMLAGSLTYTAGEATGRVEPQHFLLFNPGTTLTTQVDDAKLLWLAISPAFFFDCALRTGLGGTTGSIALRSESNIRDKQLARLAQDLSRELAEAARGHEAVIAALMNQIVIHLLRHYASIRRTDTLELSRVGLIDRRIRRAVELMHAQLDQELSLKELAAASHLSPFHFARLFKKLTGTTPHAYLGSLRTAMAQKLLSQTDLSITQISVRVGHSSPSHFSKAFRQATGLTPRDFRSSLISSKLGN